MRAYILQIIFLALFLFNANKVFANCDSSSEPIGFVVETFCENLPCFGNYGKITAVDPDSCDTHTYRCSPFGPANGGFSIDFNTGFISLITEEPGSYSCVVEVRDQSFNSFFDTLTIEIFYRLNSSSILLEDRSIRENNAIDEIVGFVNVEDPDGRRFDIDYSLVGGDTTAFNIDEGTGTLRAAQVFDFETKNSYTITVRATVNDRPDDFAERTFNISIENDDSDDPSFSPTSISLSRNTITENNDLGDLIGLLEAEDEDSFNFQLSYEIVGGDTSAFRLERRFLRANTVFDFETKNTYNVTIRVTDQDDNSFDQSFEIKIHDRFEFGEDPNKNAPVISSLSSNVIYRDTAVNEVIATINFTDPDNEDDEVSFSIRGPKRARRFLTIEGNQIILKREFKKSMLRRRNFRVRIRAIDDNFDTTTFKANFRFADRDSSSSTRKKFIKARVKSSIKYSE